MTPRRRADVLERVVDEELVLYDPVQDEAHLLNATAAAVWDLCGGDRTIAQIAREIERGLRIPPAQARRMVGDTVASLAEKRLLTRAD